MDKGYILKYRYHGGRKKEVKLDFSVNINPLDPPKEIYNLIRENLNYIKYYPQEHSSHLKVLYAEKHGLNPENIIFGNGASELLFLYVNTIKPKRVIIPIPSFSEYYIAASIEKREIIMPLYREEKEEFIPPIARIVESIIPETLIIIGNPNNPTGTLYNEKEILYILDISLKNGAYLFIDEAFIDFSNFSFKTETLIKRYPNLFLLRSFTKIFSIPGIRLGWGMGNMKIIKNMEAMRDPWSVNIFAQIIGERLLYEDEFIKKTQEIIKIEREFIYSKLIDIHRLRIYRTFSNFYLLRFFNIDTQKLLNFLLKNDIYVRDASNFMGLSDGFIRISIKNRKENELIINYIKFFLDSLHFA